MKKFDKPQSNEYAPFYSTYIDKVTEGVDILKHLKDQIKTVKTFFLGLNEEQLMYAYAPGKWTPKEILLHLIDCERIFTYRALRFSRNDQTLLAGFDENEFALNSNANKRTIKDLLKEYESVRKATLSLYNTLDKRTSRKYGKANEQNISVRALIFIIAGHELHHLKVVEEKYLN
jgi:hypothetical protein